MAVNMGGLTSSTIQIIYSKNNTSAKCPVWDSGFQFDIPHSPC